MTYRINAPQFALEEDDRDPARYHRIHTAGCRHLRDPEPIGPAEDFTELVAAAARVTSEFGGPDDVRAAIAPCVARTFDCS